MAMFQGAADDGAEPLLDVTAVGNSDKPVAFKFRLLVLGIRFVVCLKRTRSPPPPLTSGSDTVIDIPSQDNKKQRLKRIVKEKNLEALKEFGGVEEAVSFLHLECLLQIDAQTVCGRGFWGSLLLFVKEFWGYLWNSLNSWTILFLVIAAGLTFAIESLEQGVKDGWHDGFGILLAVFLLVFVPPVFSIYRRKAEEKELLKNKNDFEVTVKRNEICQMVSVFDVREGEIIHLKKGDRVPADGLLIEGKNLILDEVINSVIDLNQNPFIFFGSVVEHGEAEMIAVCIDQDTAFGKGLLDVITHPSLETLFQSRIDQPYQFLEKFSLAVSLMIMVVVLIRFLCKKHDDYYNDKPETKGKLTAGIVVKAFERMFLKFRSRVSFLATVLLTMVIGVQHGMPFAITLSLSFLREKMKSLRGNCQNLSTCGTLGLVSVICIDITAELSFHEVEYCEFFVGEQKINPGMEFHPDIHQNLDLAAKVLCSDPKASVHLGNNLLQYLLEIKFGTLDQKFDIIDRIVLSSEKGIGAWVSKSSRMDTEANPFYVHYCGDASTIVNMCSQYYDIRGIVHDIENRKDVFEEMIRDMKEKGLSPIAFACKQTKDHQEFVGESKLLGFIGLKFSHEKTLGALKDLENIGVRIILLSEDELSMATSMADGLGTQRDINKVVEGGRFREIMMIDGTEKNELMKSVTCVKRATPKDKLLVVKEFKAQGNVVASLSGLTSRDVPTLMEADVGIVHENRSTVESRRVSDIICEDVTSLNHILKYSRCIYLNIQKFYQVQLISSGSALVITLVCTMISGQSPIATLHLIWVTLIMCLLGCLMMVMELNDEEVQAPLQGRDRNQSLITKVIWYKILSHVLCQALVFLLFEYLGQKIVPHMEEDVRHTMIFSTFMLCQIANLLAAMGLISNGGAFRKAVLQNLWFIVALGSVLAVQVVAIEFAGDIVNGVKLSAVQWSICFFFASLLLILQ